jgi:hypothetical protein
MNDFSDLEQQLKKLRPVSPSQQLISRIESALAETPARLPAAGISARPRQFNWNWLSLGFGLAAATAVLIFARLNMEQPQTAAKNVAIARPAKSVAPAATTSLVPSDFTRVVYHTRDEGLRFPAGAKQPMRRVRSNTRETVEWRNPRTGASLRITYPSEEISLVPISGQ